MNFLCEICGAVLKYNRYLVQHKSRVHGLKARIKTGEFTCDVCDKAFPSKKTLANHTASMHREKRSSIECQEENCHQKFHLLSKLRNHLACVHGIQDMEVCQNLEFVKYEDFKEWLVEEEKRTSTKYIISSKTHGSGYEYTKFSCHRSGIYKTTVVDRQRQLKAKGTRKLGFHCTSSINVKELPSKILVSYYKEHYKHLRDFSYTNP